MAWGLQKGYKIAEVRRGKGEAEANGEVRKDQAGRLRGEGSAEEPFYSN